MRKTLSHGFSSTALAGQEDRVYHFINLLIDQIEKLYTQAPGDITKWYNYTTFDVIGELAFGDPFGCLESSASPSHILNSRTVYLAQGLIIGKPHFWIKILFSTIKNMNFMRSFEYALFLRSLVRIALTLKLLLRRVYALRAKMLTYEREKLEKCVSPTLYGHESRL